jgi:hypothetical protein
MPIPALFKSNAIVLLLAALPVLPTFAATDAPAAAYQLYEENLVASASDGENQFQASVASSKHPIVLPYKEAPVSSWALALDNDVLAPGHRDQDYTYGFNFTYTGSKAKDLWFSLDKPLGGVDRFLGADNLSSNKIVNHSIEAGLFGFTPEDIEVAEANPNDRPYASLIYLSSAREQIDIVNQVAWKTTLTVGLLGTGFAGNIQNGFHDVISGSEARGWDHEISDGGELTARYAIARQKYVGTIFDNMEIKSTLQASVGYLTEASWSLSIRDGKYHTPWSSFNPELASYGEKSTYTTSARPINEHYFWAGVAVKARAYNAFLQGQFRHSDVTYNNSELNPILIEAWVGYTFAFAEGYRISYVLRGHSSEIKEGAGDRNLVWGGLILAKTFD